MQAVVEAENEEGNESDREHNNGAHRAAAAVTAPSPRPATVHSAHATNQDILECLDEQELKLANGKTVSIVNGASVGQRTNMPVVKGQVGDIIVDTLRNTGCSTVVVK